MGTGIRKIASITLKTFALILLFCLAAAMLWEASPIYDFAPPAPFRGPDIYNPYSRLDTTVSWKRANFHTHTRVNGPLNECPMWPSEVLDSLEGYGYGIVTFSNHNALTEDPRDSAFHYNVYEHGYNLLKYHKLVFGCSSVVLLDNLVPFLASQRQWELDLLGKDADFIQLNHPYRTPLSTKGTMEKLSGYSLIELDSGVGTGQEYWDWALSAGHYSFALAADDLHFPDRSWCIAVRCAFLGCKSAKREDIKQCLTEGCFWCMRIPDYGNGDWKVKHGMNRNLPSIEWIGIRGKDSIRVKLDRPADRIVFTGQDGMTLFCAEKCSEASYRMSLADSYARITCFFPGGEVIYTNAFARYDSSAVALAEDGSGISPAEDVCRSAALSFPEAPHTVNWPLTVCWNLLLLALAALFIFLAGHIVSRRFKKDSRASKST